LEEINTFEPIDGSSSGDIYEEELPKLEISDNRNY